MGDRPGRAVPGLRRHRRSHGPALRPAGQRRRRRPGGPGAARPGACRSSSAPCCCWPRCTTWCSPSRRPSWPAGTRASTPPRRSGGGPPATTRTRPSAASASTTGTRSRSWSRPAPPRPTRSAGASRWCRPWPRWPERPGGPLSLLEVGCSAGLNLRLDRYRLGYGDPARWVGDPASALPLRRAASSATTRCRSPAALPVIADRVGLDRSPIDVHDEEAVRWLEACVFPDRRRPDRAPPDGRRDRPRRARAARAGRRRRRTWPRWRRRCVRTGPCACSTAGRSRTSTTATASPRPSAGWPRPGATCGGSRSSRPARCPGSTCPPRDERLTPEMAANTVLALMHVTPDGRTDRVLARSHPHLDWIQWLA